MQDDLQTHYRQALPSRIAALEHARDAGADSEILAIAHALRGSGATYGFPEVTAAAAALEAATSDELRMRTDHLIAALRAVVAGDSRPDEEAPPPLRVLLVDDDPEIRLIVTHLLRGAGYDVDEAADAGSAQAAISARTPDVVLMDIMLEKEDGVDTAAALFRSMAGPPPRLIFLTGAVRAEQFERMNAAGAAGIIHKPFDPDAFLSLFARLVGLPQ
ncbi:MAG TPA: response regulator [Longimicrobiales bacterium]|nr:response regulator [Longimicrobiales bacterium]